MASFHTRSISLPSTSHPIADQFDQHLCRLRSSQAASISSLSLSEGLTALNDLYACVDELLQLPSSQQAVSKNHKFLDGSLRLLDICGTSRDVLEQSKEQLQDIQSVIRRRSSGDLNITKEVLEYLNNRKRTKKSIRKCLKTTREADNSETVNGIDSMLKDVEDITMDIFKSLLSYISFAQSQQSIWSLVTKFRHHKNIAAASTSEFDAVDVALVSLTSRKKTVNIIQVENIRSQMVKLDSAIQALDEELKCMFRHLVKTRTTLLNI